MKQAYIDWIKAYESAHGIRGVLGKCHTVCTMMQMDFPELVLQGGYAHTPLGQELHYWLQTTKGEIVDPTASQFSTFTYENAHTTDTWKLLERFTVIVPTAAQV